jgi:hypothetical protein
VCHAKSKGQPQTAPLPLPPDQDQRDRQEVGQDDLDSGLVRAGGEELYLLPVQGSETQWYKNVLKNPSIRIDARGEETQVRAQPITESKTLKSVIEKFREKYGAKDVKKYYSKFDVAAVVQLT